MIPILAAVVTLAVVALLTLAPFAKKDSWRATVTPLASIIGSGFLVCAPVLAREFGAYAALAMGALLALAYAVGSVVRFNILNAEPYLAEAKTHDSVAWLARGAQLALSLAYAVSVAYYLKLLAAFLLHPLAFDTPLASNILVTCLLAGLAALSLTGGIKRAEHLAHGTVSIKLAIIAGILAALAAYWISHPGADTSIPAAEFTGQKVFILLGLLITVQGFETSRYLGESYDAPTRIRTMRHAQVITSVIYLAFLVLLTPFLARAAQTEGVAGILDIMRAISPLLVGLVVIAAVTSEISAAMADSIGAAGIVVELSKRRIAMPAGFALAACLAVTVVWLTDPFQVIALSSRAFALYYALQCAIAIVIATRAKTVGWLPRAGFVVLCAVCLLAAVAGAPAE